MLTRRRPKRQGVSIADSTPLHTTPSLSAAEDTTSPSDPFLSVTKP